MNLLESLKGLLTGELVSDAATELNETPAGISKALSGIVPYVLNNVAEKATTDGEGILNLAQGAAGTGILDNLNGLFNNKSGTDLAGIGSSILGTLFGTQSNNVSKIISAYSGIKASNSTALLSAVAPIALGLIGKYAGSNNLTAGGLQSWLSGQKTNIREAIPAGLNTGNVLNAPGTPVSTNAGEAMGSDNAKMPGWIMPLLLVLLGGLLVWYFLRGAGAPQEVASLPAPTAVMPADSVVQISFKVKLADGTELNALKGGIEDKLVTCMSDSACTPGKDRWFDFDNLNFEMGSAKITAESEVQVQNIAAILKAYPALKIKIGGYTDRTGDDKANKKLSQDRAVAVLEAIKTAGGNASQLEGAEGYGSDFATIPAEASDEERKIDRRISVSVRAK